MSLPQPPFQPSTRTVYPWLTALRGFFAVWITLNHIGSPYYGPAPWIEDVLHLVELRPFDIPTMGFFILSGIIFGSSRQPSPDMAGVAAFWRARLARIYPIYLLALLTCAPRGWIKSGGDIGTFVFSGVSEALFLQGYTFGMTEHIRWNPISWFMSCIAFCYLLYPFISRWIIGSGNPRRLFTVGLLAAFATCVLGVLTSAGVLPGNHEQIRYTPHYCVPAFILGASIGGLLRQRERMTVLGLVLSASVLSVLSVTQFFQSHEFYFMVFAGPLALIIVLIALAPGAPPKFMTALGEVAFTLYMTHWTLHLWFKGVSRHFGVEEAYRSPLGLILYFAALALLVRLINRKFERPLQRLLDPPRAALPTP